MRIDFKRLPAAWLLLLGLLAPCAAGQSPDTMMPEQSAAKAHEILGQLITAMGGPTYLQVRQSECTGRLSQFGRNDDLSGYVAFHDYWIYPDKNRIEYGKKGNIIDVYVGDKGWTLDKSGVSEQPVTGVVGFQVQVENDTDNLLRFHLKDPGLVFRYGGQDLIDLKPADWVEIEDAGNGNRTVRLAVDRGTHLLARSVVVTSDETTRERSDQTTFYSNYHLQDGVQTALQVARERNGRRMFQAFFESCKYNPGFPADLFTKENLEKRYAELYSKKDRDKAQKERDKS